MKTTLVQRLALPGGSTECPRKRCGAPVFHLYDENGKLEGVTCTLCDWHRFASPRTLTAARTTEGA